MLESIENFISRLSIYAEMPHSMLAVDEILVVKLMVVLMSTVALVTRKLKKRRSSEYSSPICYFIQQDAVKWVKNFFAVKDINIARQRLDRALQELEEDRAVGARSLRAVEGG